MMNEEYELGYITKVTANSALVHLPYSGEEVEIPVKPEAIASLHIHQVVAINEAKTDFVYAND